MKYTDNLAGINQFLIDNEIEVSKGFNPKTSEDDYMLVEGLKDIFSEKVVNAFLTIVTK